MKKVFSLKLNQDLKISALTGIAFQLTLLVIGLVIAKLKQVELLNYNFNWDSVWHEDIINHAYIGTTERNIHALMAINIIISLVAYYGFITPEFVG